MEIDLNGLRRYNQTKSSHDKTRIVQFARHEGNLICYVSTRGIKIKTRRAIAVSDCVEHLKHGSTSCN